MGAEPEQDAICSFSFLSDCCLLSGSFPSDALQTRESASLSCPRPAPVPPTLVLRPKGGSSLPCASQLTLLPPPLCPPPAARFTSPKPQSRHATPYKKLLVTPCPPWMTLGMAPGPLQPSPGPSPQVRSQRILTHTSHPSRRAHQLKAASGVKHCLAAQGTQSVASWESCVLGISPPGRLLVPARAG